MKLPDDNTALIYDLSNSELTEQLVIWGEPTYRIKQIWKGLYQNLWGFADEFTNIPGKLRDRLNERYTFSGLTPSVTLESRDHETQKTMFLLRDSKAIEAVLMRYSNRRTLCISTQAGCAMGCVFCATGQMGFHRQLTSGEIIEQVLYYARQLKLFNQQVTNIVMMGMGEPFHNYDATLQAIHRLNDPDGYNFGARRFTISTVGLIPMIRRFTGENHQINLAISLHAADDDLRNQLIPINRKYPLKELMTACQEYVNRTHRRITFEWALIQGVNDSIAQAQNLANLLRIFKHGDSYLCHVNIIPLNPTNKYEGKATQNIQARTFQSELNTYGIPCTIRIRRGIDIQAGCGQLASRQ